MTKKLRNEPEVRQRDQYGSLESSVLDQAHKLGLFNIFAHKISNLVGSPFTFILASCFVIIWAISGYFFNYSDSWQLIINTATTIITFLVVFLIQNTQNRDTKIINLKLDELIVAKKNARNELINLAELSDDELKALEKEFIKRKHQGTEV